MRYSIAIHDKETDQTQIYDAEHILATVILPMEDGECWNILQRSMNIKLIADIIVHQINSIISVEGEEFRDILAEAFKSAPKSELMNRITWEELT